LVFKSTFDRVIAAFGLHHQQHKQLSEKLWHYKEVIEAN
jgi:hypothetical protein